MLQHKGYSLNTLNLASSAVMLSVAAVCNGLGAPSEAVCIGVRHESCTRYLAVQASGEIGNMPQTTSGCRYNLACALAPSVAQSFARSTSIQIFPWQRVSSD